MNRAPETLNPATLNSNNEFGKYGPTLNALLAAATSAAIWPFLFFVLAWFQDPPFDKQTLNGAIGYSLMAAWIPLWFAVSFITNCLKPLGLAERFLRWDPNVCQAILKTTTKLIWVSLPLLWLYTALESFEGGKWNDSLGRVAFMLAMFVFTIGLRQTYIAVRRFCRNCPNDREQGLGFWTRLFLGSMTFCPAILAILSAAGYHFTAVQLSWRFYWTLVIVVGVAVFTSFVSRLLLIMQFRMKLQQSRELVLSGEDESIVDIAEVTMQLNRLLRVFATVSIAIIGWQIWSSVLPAVGYLDDAGLWQKYTKDGTEWVTLRDVLVSLSVLAITTVLSRNLPGLLEIVLLDRLPLDRGGRYAISFIFRYIVATTGILMAFNWLGFSWSTVQWLAAGLTVGLGFGLQEIFANLVSGLIILIERPVRVGDFVTVNGVSGHILRVQLRATTIKDLDHRELIVPNKKFITDDVMNWTLSDRSTRVIINVGVAYGSDTTKVQRVLLDVAKENPLVKNIPMPEVVFSSFGESTLDFELRVMISTREVYYRVIHELNMAVDAAFREERIEIAFPQRDVHIHGLQNSASDSSLQESNAA
ncbi:MAG: mechanosensitive ion channel domain-containing protein [Planctomycetota bacterium]